MVKNMHNTIIHVNLVTVGLLMFKDNCLNVFHVMLGGGGMRERKERREIESFKIIIEISMQ